MIHYLIFAILQVTAVSLDQRISSESAYLGVHQDSMSYHRPCRTRLAGGA